MAIVIGANAAPTSGIGGRQTELQVLRELEQALTDAYTIVADTVFRFKGQSAPAVVFTEIDFAEWSPSATRRLFVGLTRARVHWEWVMSEAAQRLIAGRLA